jgi:hypothetical protein
MTEDKKLEELKMISHPFASLYEYIYKSMGFIEGNDARTSATATVFISTKDEWKSIEYKQEQEARKQGIPPRTATPAPGAVPQFKTAQELVADMSAQQPTKPTEPAKSEPPKKDELGPEMFGTDRYGKAWPTSIVCANLIPVKDDPARFELCGGVAKTHRSTDPEKAGYIFAICPKCNHFLRPDGRAGKLASPQE